MLESWENEVAGTEDEMTPSCWARSLSLFGLGMDSWGEALLVRIERTSVQKRLLAKRW